MNTKKNTRNNNKTTDKQHSTKNITLLRPPLSINEKELQSRAVGDFISCITTRACIKKDRILASMAKIYAEKGVFIDTIAKQYKEKYLKFNYALKDYMRRITSLDTTPFATRALRLSATTAMLLSVSITNANCVDITSNSSQQEPVIESQSIDIEAPIIEDEPIIEDATIIEVTTEITTEKPKETTTATTETQKKPTDPVEVKVLNYSGMVDKALNYHQNTRYKIDKELVLAMISVESKGDPTQISSAGARGLMQIIPRWHSEAFKENMIAHGKSVSNVETAMMDEEMSIDYGTLYLSKLVDTFDGDYYKAVQAYNMGEGAIKDLSKRYGGSWKAHLDEKTGDSEYVDKIIKAYRGFGGKRL